MSTIGLKEAFREAVARLLQDVRLLGYTPREYRQLIREHGELEAARLLQHRPQSCDSLAIAARDRADLTIEWLVCRDDWADLFTEEEVTIARQRLASFAPPPLAEPETTTEETLPAVFPVSSGRKLQLSLSLDLENNESLDDEFDGNDDLVWGEELAEGINVCEKLREENAESAQQPVDYGVWVWALFRQHLRTCKDCAANCTTIAHRLDEIDRNFFEALSRLLPEMEKACNIGVQRARDLLSREWKSAGYVHLPSDTVTSPDVTRTGFYKPQHTEWEQQLDWLKILEWRAVLLCRYVGSRMLDFEDTHQFRRTLVAGDALLWLSWSRSERGESNQCAQAFVNGLDQSKLLLALCARHLVSILGYLPRHTEMIVPTDGDLEGVPGLFRTENATKIEDWKRILGLPDRSFDGGALLQVAHLAAERQVGGSATISSASNVSDVYCELTGILDWVKEPRDRNTTLVDRIRQAVDRGRVPASIGIHMHTVRLLRNQRQHGNYRLSQNELKMVNLVWDEIKAWAQSQGWKSSTLV